MPDLTESQQETIEEEALKPLKAETEKQLENISLTENDIIILLKYNDEKKIITFNIQTKQQPSGKAEMFGTFMDTRGKSEFTSDFTSILESHPKKDEIFELYNSYRSQQQPQQPKKSLHWGNWSKNTKGGKKTKSTRSYNANKTLKNRK